MAQIILVNMLHIPLPVVNDSRYKVSNLASSNRRLSIGLVLARHQYKCRRLLNGKQFDDLTVKFWM